MWGVGRGVTLAAILLAVAGGAAVFLRMIMILQVLTIREWVMLPMSERLLRGKKNGKIEIIGLGPGDLPNAYRKL